MIWCLNGWERVKGETLPLNTMITTRNSRPEQIGQATLQHGPRKQTLHHLHRRSRRPMRPQRRRRIRSISKNKNRTPSPNGRRGPRLQRRPHIRCHQHPLATRRSHPKTIPAPSSHKSPRYGRPDEDVRTRRRHHAL